MNRQKFITRGEEGLDDRARALALALAEISDPEFLETLLHYKSSLDEYGGQVFIAAARDKFGENGQGDPEGRFHTWGYITHFSSKATIRHLETEEGVDPIDAPADPDEEQAHSPNGVEPEPVES